MQLNKPTPQSSRSFVTGHHSSKFNRFSLQEQNSDVAHSSRHISRISQNVTSRLRSNSKCFTFKNSLIQRNSVFSARRVTHNSDKTRAEHVDRELDSISYTQSLVSQKINGFSVGVCNKKKSTLTQWQLDNHIAEIVTVKNTQLENFDEIVEDMKWAFVRKRTNNLDGSLVCLKQHQPHVSDKNSSIASRAVLNLHEDMQSETSTLFTKQSVIMLDGSEDEEEAIVAKYYAEQQACRRKKTVNSADTNKTKKMMARVCNNDNSNGSGNIGNEQQKRKQVETSAQQVHFLGEHLATSINKTDEAKYKHKKITITNKNMENTQSSHDIKTLEEVYQHVLQKKKTNQLSAKQAGHSSEKELQQQQTFSQLTDVPKYENNNDTILFIDGESQEQARISADKTKAFHNLTQNDKKNKKQYEQSSAPVLVELREHDEAAPVATTARGDGGILLGHESNYFHPSGLVGGVLNFFSENMFFVSADICGGFNDKGDVSGLCEVSLNDYSDVCLDEAHTTGECCFQTKSFVDVGKDGGVILAEEIVSPVSKCLVTSEDLGVKKTDQCVTSFSMLDEHGKRVLFSRSDELSEDPVDMVVAMQNYSWWKCLFLPFSCCRIKPPQYN